MVGIFAPLKWVKEQFKKVNSDMEWKFLQQVTGSTNVALPTDYKEIIVEATRPRETLKDIKYTFHLCKDQLGDTEVYYPAGKYGSASNHENLSILATNKYVHLYGWSDTGADATASCYIKVWYR